MTQVDSALEAEVSTLERRTGMSVSDLLRAGLMKLVREMKDTGSIKFEAREA